MTTSMRYNLNMPDLLAFDGDSHKDRIDKLVIDYHRVTKIKPGGLEDIAKAFKKKKGSQYQQYCKWLGIEELDLSVFDIDDMNFRLKKIPRIYADAYEYGLEPTKQSIALLTRKYKKN